jgi:crotonobetainyl-CoA:carnitine CoA-transferase CaiB-like acyl-CoA transferase
LGSYPYYAVYETKDGKYLSIGCLEPHFWENLYKFLRKKDFIRHSWNPKTEHAKPDDIHNEMFTCMKEIFLTKARDEWFDLLAPENIPVVRVNDLNEVFSDLQVIARNMVIEVEDPKVGIMPKLSKTPGSVWSVAPLHGDHTDEILFKIGIPRGEIDQMRKEGIIG